MLPGSRGSGVVGGPQRRDSWIVRQWCDIGAADNCRIIPGSALQGHKQLPPPTPTTPHTHTHKHLDIDCRRSCEQRSRGRWWAAGHCATIRGTSSTRLSSPSCRASCRECQAVPGVRSWKQGLSLSQLWVAVWSHSVVPHHKNHLHAAAGRTARAPAKPWEDFLLACLHRLGRAACLVPGVALCPPSRRRLQGRPVGRGSALPVERATGRGCVTTDR